MTPSRRPYVNLVTIMLVMRGAGQPPMFGPVEGLHGLIHAMLVTNVLNEIAQAIVANRGRQY